MPVDAVTHSNLETAHFNPQLDVESFEDGRLTLTPGHEVPGPDGHHHPVDALVNWESANQGRITLIHANGALRPARVERIVYSAQTAHLYEQASATALSSGYSVQGNLALKHADPDEGGWLTCNFEVETIHSYVAAQTRVHNDSLPDVIEKLYGDLWDKSAVYHVTATQGVDAEGRPIPREGWFQDIYGNTVILKTRTENGVTVGVEAETLVNTGNEALNFFTMQEGKGQAYSLLDENGEPRVGIKQEYSLFNKPDGTTGFKVQPTETDAFLNGVATTIGGIAGLLGAGGRLATLDDWRFGETVRVMATIAPFGGEVVL